MMSVTDGQSVHITSNLYTLDRKTRVNISICIILGNPRAV